MPRVWRLCSKVMLELILDTVKLECIVTRVYLMKLIYFFLFCRELPCFVHWGEGFWLQGLQLSQSYPWFHVPGKLEALSVCISLVRKFSSESTHICVFFIRVETLLTAMALEENRSTGRSFRMKTSRWNIQDLVYCLWLTLGPIPTDPSSSSAQLRLLGELKPEP